MSPFEDRDRSLAIESELGALVHAGHSRADATMVMIERMTTEARGATTVVLVEGLSDQIALEVLAERRGMSHRCVTDLEDEMIRALGSGKVEQIVEAEGELGSFRTLQQMPFHRRRSLDDQLHRFIGAHSGRKYRYARSLALSLDLTSLPAPLAGLLGQL